MAGPRTKAVTLHGETTKRWKRSNGTPATAATAAFIGSAWQEKQDEGLAEMRFGQAVDRGDDPVLHRLKGLSFREAKGTRSHSNRLPFAEFAQGLQLGPGPLAEIALREARLGPDGQAEKVREGLRGLLGAL